MTTFHMYCAEGYREAHMISRLFYQDDFRVTYPGQGVHGLRCHCIHVRVPNFNSLTEYNNYHEWLTTDIITRLTPNGYIFFDNRPFTTLLINGPLTTPIE